MSAEEREALDARRDLIEARARALAETAVRTHAAWVQCITTGDPLGPEGETTAQRRDAHAVQTAVTRARSAAQPRVGTTPANRVSGRSL